MTKRVVPLLICHLGAIRFSYGNNPMVVAIISNSKRSNSSNILRTKIKADKYVCFMV